jgi:hypothetical protein
MPFVRVSVDQMVDASIDTHGKDMVSVLVSGSLVNDAGASLAVNGGTYGSETETNHLTWIDQPLQLGQVVRVELLASAMEVGKGKTLEEMYPRDPSDAEPTPSRSKMISELAAMPLRRPAFSVRLSGPSNLSGSLESEPGELGFGFSVIWSMNRSNEANVALHAYSLETIRSKAHGRYAVQGKLGIGNELSCELVA